MIKLIEGYELKRDADIQPVFLKLRSYAMTFPGFISAEHIRSVNGASIAALLYNWKGLEDWEAWKSSIARILSSVAVAMNFEQTLNPTRYSGLSASEGLLTRGC
jgi:antibiotic biosynthesis monooxygenase (ABM) superfamily enzyme